MLNALTRKGEENMKIGGLQKMTLIDYPRKISATVFTCGCNFACPMCHNPELLDCKTQIKKEDFFNWLKTRKDLLDGVCITGGEPTINKDLPEFIRKIKEMDFLVKLDTNGSSPKMLEKLYKEKQLDFVAMDIKSSKEKYQKACNKKINIDNIRKSINLIRNSNVDYEFRTTVIPEIIEEDDIKKIGQWIKGSKAYVLQQFRPAKTLDKALQKIQPYPEEKLKEFKKIAEPYFAKVELRGLK